MIFLFSLTVRLIENWRCVAPAMRASREGNRRIGDVQEEHLDDLVRRNQNMDFVFGWARQGADSIERLWHVIFV